MGTRNVNSAFARELAAKGVSVRAADFREPAQMRRAFEGVSKALLIPTYDTNDVRLQQNLNAVQAAKDAGVGHVVYASFLKAESPLVEHSRLVHFPTEQAIRASGLGFTILRHALYADILVGDLADTLSTGSLHRPSGTRARPISRAPTWGFRRRRSSCAMNPLASPIPRPWSAPTTGWKSPATSEVFGKPIRFVAVDPTDWPRYMTEKWQCLPRSPRAR